MLNVSSKLLGSQKLFIAISTCKKGCCVRDLHKRNGLKIVDVNYVWNVTAHAQKPDFVFRRNGRVHLNRMGHQFSRLLAAEVCASAIVMLDTPSSEVVWRVLTTHSIRQFPLHFPSRASPCAIMFQLDSTYQMSQRIAHFCPWCRRRSCLLRRTEGGTKAHKSLLWFKNFKN